MATGGAPCDLVPGSVGTKVFQSGSSSRYIDRILTDKKMSNRVKDQMLKIEGEVVVNLANGKMVSGIDDGMEGFLERDYGEIFKITTIDPRTGKTGATFVPLEWLSSNPELLDPVEGSKKFKDAKDNNLLSQAQLKKRYEELRKYRGEAPEKTVYDQMKLYAEKTGHELILIHGPHIFNPGKGEQEADFIIVDRTLGAIINVEVKVYLDKTKNNALQKAVLQLDKNKKLLEAWFDDLLDTLQFIGMIYTESVEPGIDICPSCDPFVMVGEADILNKMLKLGDELKKAGYTAATNPMAYRSLAKYLLFAVHANKSGAPVAGKMVREVHDRVMKAGTEDNISYWSCWTPSQQGLVGSQAPRFTLFPSSMSTGKTEVLVGKAMERARAGEKVLVVVFGYNCSKETLLFYKLKKRFQSLNNVVVRYLNVDSSTSDLKDSISKLRTLMVQFKDHHVMGDELVLPEPKYLSQVAKDVEQLRMELEMDTGVRRLFWIVLAGGMKFTTADFSVAKLQTIFKGFYVAVFTIPLRGTRHVTSAVKNQATCTVDNFQSNINLELPENLVQGIPPAFHYYYSEDEKSVTKAVKEAMQEASNTVNTGIAIIVNTRGGYGDADKYIGWAVRGVEDAGRQTPLVYCGYSSTLGTAAGEADLDKWMEDTHNRPDLVVEVDVARGWEEDTVLYINVGSSIYGPENVYLRTITKLIVVDKKRYINKCNIL